MKKYNFILVVSAMIVFSAFVSNNTINWQIKEGYVVKFTGSSASGVFEKMKGNISFDENDLATSKLFLSIDVASIATGNWLKNRHARGDNWFNAEKYPTINFTSHKCTKSGSGFQVEGTLDMHGVKKAIVIPFTFSNNTFKAKFSVNRIDYGIGTLEGMSKKVSNEIKLEVLIPVAKK
jgi:polyisoprenoid-binding protein YceI